jgi:hypothetical protein
MKYKIKMNIQKYVTILVLGMSSISFAMQKNNMLNDDVLQMICPVAQLTQAQLKSLKQYCESKKDPVVDVSDGYWMTSRRLSIFTMVKRVEQKAKL